MKIDAYVSFLDPNGVDVVNDIFAYLASATASRTSGKPYHYPQMTDVKTLAPRADMYINLSGVSDDVDYIVLRYTAPADGYSGDYCYFAEHIPNDSADTFAAKRFRLRIDSWATFRIHGTIPRVCGTLVRGHSLLDHPGALYIDQPRDIDGNVSVKPFNPSGVPANIKTQICAEIETAKGKLFFVLGPYLANINQIKNVIAALWLCDKIDLPDTPTWLDLDVKFISRVWLLPYEITSALYNYAPIVDPSVALKVTDAQGKTFFDELTAGIIAPSTWRIPAYWMAGATAFVEDVSFPASAEFRAIGNSIVMAPIPAGSACAGVMSIDFNGPAAFELNAENPSPIDLSIAFHFRGETIDFTDSLEVDIGSVDRSERSQKIIANSLELISGGVSLGVGVGTGNVAGGINSLSAAGQRVVGQLSEKYGRQMVAGHSVADIMKIWNAGDAATSPTTYGLSIISADSSNREATYAEALLFGPSGAKRFNAYLLAIVEDDPEEPLDPIRYAKFASGCRVNRSALDPEPIYLYRDLERRLENGVRIWDESQGYCNV